jgi:hypothetical protein
MNIFTASSPASTINVLWDHPECVEQPGKQHRAVTIAEEENSVTLPVEVAFDIAAEVLGFLMDEDDARNRHGSTLREFLGKPTR